MKKLKIGADELILSMRKNEVGQNFSNEHLGRKIHDLITLKLGEEMKEKNVQAHWANETGDKNIAKDNLPKTAAQYEIDTDKLKMLFDEILTW